MLRPLTEDQMGKLIDEATNAFAEKGFAGASISGIAKRAGVSVGVIYKYYKDKKALFTACVEKSLAYLDEVFEEVGEKNVSLMEMVSDLIRSNQQAARLHPEYFRLYHQITVRGAEPGMESIAEMIEKRSADLYTEVLEKAKAEGKVRNDMEPSMFAFFFDNLMMMLHFAYTSRYYEDRFRIYCGSAAAADDAVVHDEMMKFIGGAFGAAE